MINLRRQAAKRGATTGELFACCPYRQPYVYQINPYVPLIYPGNEKPPYLFNLKNLFPTSFSDKFPITLITAKRIPVVYFVPVENPVQKSDNTNRAAKKRNAPSPCVTHAICKSTGEGIKKKETDGSEHDFMQLIPKPWSGSINPVNQNFSNETAVASLVV